MSTENIPHDPEAETAVLSCIMDNPEMLLDEARLTLHEDAFHHPANGLIYRTMQEMRSDERPVEYLTVTSYMRDKGTLDAAGGQSALSEVFNATMSGRHFNYFVQRLNDKLKLRRIMAACSETLEQAAGFQQDVSAFVSQVAERYFELTRQQQGEGRKAFKDIMHSYVETWEQRMKGSVKTGIPTRWHSFNARFGGITPHLWLIAGYPSDGKSSLAQNLIEDALDHGEHALWFHYESNETEVVDRLMTARTKLNSQKIFFPQNGIQRDESRLITRAVGEMVKWGLHLRCEATWTVEQIVAETRAMRLKHPIGLVVVDYLQLIPSSKDFGTNRAQEVAYMSRTLKNGSASMNLPFIILSQLNDDGKTKESRAPNQDAHNIVFIEAGQEESKDAKGKAIPGKKGGLRVVKNRNGERQGKLLPITLDPKGTFTFIESLRRDDEPEEKGQRRTKYTPGDE